MAVEGQFVEATQALGCDLAMDVARTFGSVRLRVSGTSMAPAMRPGDLLSVEAAGMGEVSPGDIVVFAQDCRLIAHRLVAKSERAGKSYLVTRGDRTRRNDGLVSGRELVGRVTRIERGGFRVSAGSQLSLTQQFICRLLRFSDRATYLYLRLAAL
jgi:signal peptidase